MHQRTMEPTYSSSTANCDVGYSQVECFAMSRRLLLFFLNLQTNVTTTTASSHDAKMRMGIWANGRVGEWATSTFFPDDFTGPPRPRPTPAWMIGRLSVGQAHLTLKKKKENPYFCFIVQILRPRDAPPPPAQRGAKRRHWPHLLGGCCTICSRASGLVPDQLDSSHSTESTEEHGQKRSTAVLAAPSHLRDAVSLACLACSLATRAWRAGRHWFAWVIGGWRCRVGEQPGGIPQVVVTSFQARLTMHVRPRCSGMTRPFNGRSCRHVV